MKGKLKKFLLAACLTIPCALVTTACDKESSSGGKSAGICTNNSCQFTKHFNPSEFMETPFYSWASSKNFSKKNNMEYNAWVQQNFYDIKHPQSYYNQGETTPVSYNLYHAAVCETCGNIKAEKHTFEHVEDLGDFNHSVRCTECGYTHEASCYFEQNGEFDKTDTDCFCGQEKPTYTVDSDSDNPNGIMVCIDSGTTGDIVIPRLAKGKPVSKVRFSISEDWANQQINTISIPYTAINKLEIPANNHIEKIIITGYTQAEAEELDAKELELQQKFESGEISTSEFRAEMEKFLNTVAPVPTGDAWMKLNGLTNLKSIEIAENHHALSVSNLIEIKNCPALEKVKTNSLKTTFLNCPALTSVSAGGIVFNDEDDSTLPQNLTEVTITVMASDSVLSLPSTVKTLNINNVTSIPYGFLCENSTIETVNAPGVLTVGYEAFYGCTGLKTVNLPDATEIGYRTFYGCTKLENVNIQNVEEMGDRVFDGCTSLESVDISKATDLDWGIFNNCTGLKTVTLGDNLTELTMDMFNGCSNLEEITIPKGVTFIDYSIFSLCPKLKTIRYNAINATLDSRSNMFYESCGSVVGGAELIIGKDVEKLPKNLTKTANGESQDEAINITKVTFEEGSKLTTIEQGAISNLKITTITLPSTVTTVEDGAFANNYFLETINYGSLDLSAAILNNCPAYEFEVVNGLKYFGKTLIGVEEIVTSIAPREGTTKAVQLEGVNFVPEGIKPYIESVIMPNTIIEWSASFAGLSNLETVTLSNGLTEISDEMFQNCASLASITIPNSVEKIGESAFRNCQSLTSVNIPSSVKELDSMAFYLCTGLTSVTLNEGLTTIGSDAFSLCKKLPSITLPSTVRTIGRYAFDNAGFDLEAFAITLNEGLTEIGEYALSNTFITSISFPSTLTKIGEGAFYNSNIESVTIPSSITVIEKETFYGADFLTTITLPNTLKTIKEGAFQWCKNLQSITIPASVETIEDYAFANCTKLETINLEGNVTLSLLAVDGCTSYKGQEWNNGYYKGTILTGLVDNTASFVYIKEGTTEIASGVFTNNTAIKGVYIPESVTTITNGEFTGCTNAVVATGSTKWLQQIQMAVGGYSNTLGASKGVDELANATLDGWIYSVPSSNSTKIAGYYGVETVITIPASLGGATQITISGFEGNTSITKVYMHNNVTAISNDAFKNCTSLTEITITENVYMIGSNAFAGCTNLTKININESNIPFSVGTITDTGFEQKATVQTTDPNFVQLLKTTYANYTWIKGNVSFN